MKNAFAIATFCFEKGDSRRYVDFANRALEKWSQYFPVYIQTNLENEFKKYNVLYQDLQIMSVEEGQKLSETEKAKLDFNKLWTYHDRVDIVYHALQHNEICFHIDCDHIPTEKTFDILSKNIDQINNLRPGLHFGRSWEETDVKDSPNGFIYPEWGYFEHFDFFHYIRDNIGFSPAKNLKPVQESFYFARRFNEWPDVRRLMKEKYKKIFIENDLKVFSWKDKSPWRSVGRADGLSYALTAEELNIKNFYTDFTLIREIENSMEIHY